MKVRIVKLTSPCGRISYQIQQRHCLFRWWWVSATINYLGGEYMQDTFPTLEEATAKLCQYDGTKTLQEVVLIK